MHLPMNLGYVEHERFMHWPAVNADMNKVSAFRRASLVKKYGVEFEKANEPWPSVEQSTA
jgi:peroxiredoxin